MNIKRAKEEIKNTVRAYLMKDGGKYDIPASRQRPMLLIGPPGIGKTQIVEQAARECRIGLVSYTITHHTRQSAVGLPFIREDEFDGKKYSITEYTMSEIIASVYKKIEENGIKEGILFMDEINCVSETLAPAMLQFLQFKTFGSHRLPDGWIVVAAGNPPEYNKSVREFDMATLDRVRKIEVEADYGAWREYARANHVSAAILSYLELRPQNFYKARADVDGLQFTTARGWEDLSSLVKVYEKLSLEVDEEIIYEFLQHRDVARDVSAYFDLYRKYRDDYAVADILSGSVQAKVYERAFKAAFDERLSVVNLLISGLNVFFDKAYGRRFIADGWFLFLKRFKEKIADGTDGYKIYGEMYDDCVKKIEGEKKSGFYTGRQEKMYDKLADMLALNRPQRDAGENAFEQARKGFDEWRRMLYGAEGEAMTALENAFDFMEGAFKNGQEMVVFVSELAMNESAASFLSQNKCERYLKYSEELMIGTKRAELLSMIDRSQIYANEGAGDF